MCGGYPFYAGFNRNSVAVESPNLEVVLKRVLTWLASELERQRRVLTGESSRAV